MTATQALLQSNLLGLQLLNRGKVRDVYEIDPFRLLFVATDRISAFDCVMPNGIPDKGRVLTQISRFWFDKLGKICPNHLITSDVRAIPVNPAYYTQLAGRSMLVKRLRIVPVECIVRGYLAGSGWKEYQRSRTVCGIVLPEGLVESDKLPEAIFTPSTKAETGHDENITFGSAVEVVMGWLKSIDSNLDPARLVSNLQRLSLDLYLAAAWYARERHIILADTKFEFGLDEAGNLVLADEVLTPDSSRFWDLRTYEPGRAQDSFDKQYVRDYLESTGWDKTPPAPELPLEIVAGTRDRYLEAHRLLTDKELSAA